MVKLLDRVDRTLFHDPSLSLSLSLHQKRFNTDQMDQQQTVTDGSMQAGRPEFLLHQRFRTAGSF